MKKKKKKNVFEPEKITFFVRREATISVDRRDKNVFSSVSVTGDAESTPLPYTQNTHSLTQWGWVVRY